MKSYREWLPTHGYEGTCSIGGSFVADNVEAYYLTPFELGYGPFVKFDHEFTGREALEKMLKDQRPQRKKVTFEWSTEDLARIFASMTSRTDNHKFFDLPNANYASSSYDRVMKGDKVVGLSMFTGYSDNERVALSLGVVDADVNVGDVLTLVWGEENGGTQKPTVERHTQTEVRVRVAPTPYAHDAREGYHQGWRSAKS
jgi:vanillate/3-O-methylgallate O-demethylase